jgi:hypothetical protein
MAQRFEVGEVNTIQALTGPGADFSNMGLKAFTPEQQPSISPPAPTVAIGGMKI